LLFEGQCLGGIEGIGGIEGFWAEPLYQRYKNLSCATCAAIIIIIVLIELTTLLLDAILGLYRVHTDTLAILATHGQEQTKEPSTQS